MRVFSRKLGAAALTLALALSLTACGEEPAAESQTYETAAGTAEAAESPAETAGGPLAPALEPGAYVRSAKAGGGKIYFLVRQEGNGTVTDSVLTLEPDGSEQALLWSEQTEVPAASGEPGNLGVREFCPCGDGSVWYLLGTDGGWRLVHRDGDGTALASLETEGFSFLLPAPDGGAAVFAQGVDVLDGAGRLLFSCPAEGGWFESAAALEDGSIAAVFCEALSGAATLKRLDMEAQALVTVAELESAKSWSLIGGGWDGLWLRDSVGVCLLSPESGQTARYMSWTDGGFSDADVAGAQVLPDGRLLITEQKLLSGGEGVCVYVLPADYSLSGGDRTVVRLAGAGLPYFLTEAAAGFNRAGGDYYVELVDYAGYSADGDYAAGQERLLYEINTGELPDMICFGGLSAEDMARRGYLADMDELLGGGGEGWREAFLENVLAAAEIDGALYTLPVCFTVETAQGRTDIVSGGACTVENVRAWIEENPALEPYASAPRTAVLAQLVRASGESLVDGETGACCFDSPAFISLLELAALLPEAPACDEAYYARLAAGQFLFETVDGVTLGTLAAGSERADCTLTGYPGQEGGVSVIYPSVELGVAAGTDNPAGCRAFLEYLLSQEVQTGDALCLDAIPLRAEALEAQKQALLDEGILDAARVEQAAALCRAATALDRPSSLMRALSSMVAEQAQAYFAGDRTAAETAALIQSQAEIYMAERG